jgi:hypothetical protein
MAGISGYLLLWDQRAQVAAQSILDLLRPIPGLSHAFYSAFLSDAAAEKSWLFMLLLLGLHVGLSARGGLFFWYHIQRLSRPKLFPART